jgi:undecaprenyl-diphosphatase
MESAIIYLTLGAMLMRVAERRLTKVFILSVAGLLTFLVGISRVFLGVHYPSDVIGGWIIGFVWASICWLAAQQLEPITQVKAEREKPAAS